MTQSGKPRLGIQSVEVAAEILRALSQGAETHPLKELSTALKMPAAKIHRYLVSLTRTGLARQDSVTGSLLDRLVQIGPTGRSDERGVVRHVFL